MADQRELPCVHRGATTGQLTCDLCGGEGRLIDLYPCAKHGSCTIQRASWKQEAAVCAQCQDRVEPQPGEPIILHANLSPGDILTMTAAVESLHATYPGEYQTDVRTSVSEIWEHNPWITKLDDQSGRSIDLNYPTINVSNQRSVTFLEGYTADLGDKLGRPLRLATNRPHLYLSQDERNWINQVRQHFADNRDVPFWLVNAGVKSDYTAKQWPLESYQAVVDATRGRIQWVQVGAAEHSHERLNGVIDLVGQTNHRQLIRLAWHARGGLGPVTYLQHLMAAFEKPYLCLLGGREPVTWVSYPRQHTLHTIGALPCCSTGACWKSRVTKAGDGDSKDDSLCERPTFGWRRAVPRCMALIRPEEVLAILERYPAS